MMTPALADLTAYLLISAHPEGTSDEQRDAVRAEAQDLYDAIAHELAEKIRQPLSHAESKLVQRHVPLSEILAGRIEPEEH